MATETGKTIVVVDDEELVLSLAQTSLREHGYRALTASGGKEALQLTAELNGAVDVFVIDVVMPRMGGPDLAERLRAQYPKARFVFTSGYGEGAAEALKRREPDAVYLRKPFGPAELISALDEVLEKG